MNTISEQILGANESSNIERGGSPEHEISIIRQSDLMGIPSSRLEESWKPSSRRVAARLDEGNTTVTNRYETSGNINSTSNTDTPAKSAFIEKKNKKSTKIDIEQNDASNPIDKTSDIPHSEHDDTREKNISDVCQIIEYSTDPLKQDEETESIFHQRKSINKQYSNAKSKIIRGGRFVKKAFRQRKTRIEKNYKNRMDGILETFKKGGIDESKAIGHEIDVHNLKPKSISESDKENLLKIRNNLTRALFTYTTIYSNDEEKNAILERYENQIALIDGTLSEMEKLDEDAFGEVEKKYIQGISDLAAKEKYRDNMLGISMKAVPIIINAIENGNFDDEFITQLCEKTDKIDPKPSCLDKLISQFRRISNTETRQQFCKIVHEYLTQIKNEISDEKRQEIQNKLDSFVYNTFVPPYQRDDEESCFATSLLMKLWHNAPDQYMQFVQNIINNDVADFSIFGKEIAPISVKIFGNDRSTCNCYDKVYQKSISALASLEKKHMEKNKEKFSDALKKACEDTKFSKFIPELNEAFLKDGVVWNKAWRLPICAYQNILETEKNVANQVTSKILKVIEQTILNAYKNLPLKRPPTPKLMNMLQSFKNMLKSSEYKGIEGTIQPLTDNIIKLTSSGGYGDDTLRSITTDSKEEEYEFSRESTDGTFPIDEFQPILDCLKFCPKDQFVRVDYEGDSSESGHAFNFIGGNYDLGKMKTGEKIVIGNLNYLDTNEQDRSTIYLEKVDDKTVKLTEGYGQKVGNIGSITLYHTDFISKICQIIQNGTSPDNYLEIFPSDQDITDDHDDWNKYFDDMNVEINKAQTQINSFQEEKSKLDPNDPEDLLEIESYEESISEWEDRLNDLNNSLNSELENDEILKKYISHSIGAEAASLANQESDLASKIALKIAPQLIDAYNSDSLSREFFINLVGSIQNVDPKPELLDGFAESFKKMQQPDALQNFHEKIQLRLDEIHSKKGNGYRGIRQGVQNLLQTIKNEICTSVITAEKIT